MAETRMQGHSSVLPFLGVSEVLTLVGPLQLWMCFPLFRLFAVLEGPCNSAKNGRAGGGKTEGQIYVSCNVYVCISYTMLKSSVWPLPLLRVMLLNRGCVSDASRGEFIIKINTMVKFCKSLISCITLSLRIFFG